MLKGSFLSNAACIGVIQKTDSNVAESHSRVSDSTGLRRAQDIAFLTSSQLMLLVRGSRFENHHKS